jgi:error-prone DNA polymerase
VQGAAESRATRPVMAKPPELGSGSADGHHSAAGGMGRRRVLVHSSGFAMSPYADVKPPGEDTKTAARRRASEGTSGGVSGAPRKLWHSSPGSSGG